TINIGNSSKSADIVLHDLYVSRVHCQLLIDEDKVVVTHVAGTHGTLINGQKITRQELAINDVLRVGNSHLRLELAVEDEAQGEGDEDGGSIGLSEEESADLEEAEVLDDVEEAEVVEDEEETHVLQEGDVVEGAPGPEDAYVLPHSPVDKVL